MGQTLPPPCKEASCPTTTPRGGPGRAQGAEEKESGLAGGLLSPQSLPLPLSRRGLTGAVHPRGAGVRRGGASSCPAPTSLPGRRGQDGDRGARESALRPRARGGGGSGGRRPGKSPAGGGGGLGGSAAMGRKAARPSGAQPAAWAGRRAEAPGWGDLPAVQASRAGGKGRDRRALRKNKSGINAAAISPSRRMGPAAPPRRVCCKCYERSDGGRSNKSV